MVDDKIDDDAPAAEMTTGEALEYLDDLLNSKAGEAMTEKQMRRLLRMQEWLRRGRLNR